jgi:hypothetical protein
MLLKPTAHAQVYEPGVFVHVPPEPHEFVGLHSFTSAHPLVPLPLPV